MAKFSQSWQVAWRSGNQDGCCGAVEEIRIPPRGREGQDSFLVGDLSDAV